MEIVEVFKTDVVRDEEASRLITKLSSHFPHYKINFDLQDCDHILRVQGEHIFCDRIIELIKVSGFECEVLE